MFYLEIFSIFIGLLFAIFLWERINKKININITKHLFLVFCELFFTLLFTMLSLYFFRKIIGIGKDEIIIIAILSIAGFALLFHFKFKRVDKPWE